MPLIVHPLVIVVMLKKKNEHVEIMINEEPPQYQCPMKCEEDTTPREKGKCPICKRGLKKMKDMKRCFD